MFARVIRDTVLANGLKKAQYDAYRLNQFETGYRADYMAENETNESQAGLRGGRSFSTATTGRRRRS
jgi:hypothetical protein